MQESTTKTKGSRRRNRHGRQSGRTWMDQRLLNANSFMSDSPDSLDTTEPPSYSGEDPDDGERGQYHDLGPATDAAGEAHSVAHPSSDQPREITNATLQPTITLPYLDTRIMRLNTDCEVAYMSNEELLELVLSANVLPHLAILHEYLIEDEKLSGMAQKELGRRDYPLDAQITIICTYAQDYRGEIFDTEKPRSVNFRGREMSLRFARIVHHLMEANVLPFDQGERCVTFTLVTLAAINDLKLNGAESFFGILLTSELAKSGVSQTRREALQQRYSIASSVGEMGRLRMELANVIDEKNGLEQKFEHKLEQRFRALEETNEHLIAEITTLRNSESEFREEVDRLYDMMLSHQHPAPGSVAANMLQDGIYSITDVLRFLQAHQSTFEATEHTDTCFVLDPSLATDTPEDMTLTTTTRRRVRPRATRVARPRPQTTNENVPAAAAARSGALDTAPNPTRQTIAPSTKPEDDSRAAEHSETSVGRSPVATQESRLLTRSWFDADNYERFTYKGQDFGRFTLRKPEFKRARATETQEIVDEPSKRKKGKSAQADEDDMKRAVARAQAANANVIDLTGDDD